MATEADAVALSGERELVITRTFEAPRRLVFKMWTEPGHLVRWWGPRGFTTISSRMDIRLGGTWSRSMRAPDGRIIRKYGVYREIVAPERLVLTYVTDDPEGNSGPETLITVTFTDLGGTTRLTCTRLSSNPSRRAMTISVAGRALSSALPNTCRRAPA